MRLIWGILDRICVVVGALVFAQIPLFIHLYTQRLAGHTAELSLQVEQLRQAAQMSHKTLDEYISKFLQSNDSDFSRQGEWMQHLVQRWEALSNAYMKLQQASPWDRPVQFFHYFDLQIARPTMESFEFGLPFTLEGGVYALLGVACGFLFFRGALKIKRSVGFSLRLFWRTSVRLLKRGS